MSMIEIQRLYFNKITYLSLFSGVRDGYMYIFGGFNGNSKNHFNDLYRYSAKDNSWEYIEVKGLVPCKRRRQACILYEDKVYLFGGTR